MGDPALVPVAVALGVQQRRGGPVMSALGEVLARRQLLVVLDNCEHVLAAAAQLCQDGRRSSVGHRRWGCLSSQRRCRCKRGRQRGSDLAGVDFDDVFPHGPQQVQELVLFGFPDLEVVQNRDEVFMKASNSPFVTPMLVCDSVMLSPV